METRIEAFLELLAERRSRSWPCHEKEEGRRGKLLCGIDVGSVSAKLVLINESGR